MKLKLLFLFLFFNIFCSYSQFDDLYYDKSKDFVRNSVKIPYRFNNDNSNHITYFPSIMIHRNPFMFNNFNTMDYWWYYDNFYDRPNYFYDNFYFRQNYFMNNFHNPWRNNIYVFVPQNPTYHSPKTFVSRKSGSISSSVNGRNASPRKPINTTKEHKQPLSKNYDNPNVTTKSNTTTKQNYTIRNTNTSQRTRQQSDNQKQ
jgi:hypothetical protein